MGVSLFLRVRSREKIHTEREEEEVRFSTTSLSMCRNKLYSINTDFFPLPTKVKSGKVSPESQSL